MGYEKDAHQHELSTLQDSHNHKVATIRKKHKEEVAELRRKLQDMDWGSEGWESQVCSEILICLFVVFPVLSFRKRRHAFVTLEFSSSFTSNVFKYAKFSKFTQNEYFLFL